MKKYNKILGVAFALGLFLVLSSCSNKLDLTPESSISNNSYWKTPDQFNSFVAGLHISFRSHTMAFELLGELRTQVFGTEPGSGSAFSGEAPQGVEHLWNNTLDADNSGVSNFGGFYTDINQINLLISKLNSTEVVSAADKNYDLGIAYGMRAFYYFQMYKSWGGVIIQTEPTESVDISNLAKEASSKEDVMKLIKSDIEQSENNFGDDYSFKNNKGYWSKAATEMLKAQVFLWTAHRGGGTDDATTALNALNDIQNNVSSLQLLPDYSEVFAADNSGNNEIIFAIHNELNESQLPFASTFEPQTGLIANFYDSVENRKFNVSDDNWDGILRAPIRIATYRKFSDKDSRKLASLTAAYNKSGGQYKIAGAFVSKYKGVQDAGSRKYTNDYPIYRYAGLLLLKAEAKEILGQSPKTEINEVRKRAYGSNYNASTLGFPNQSVDADPEEAILKERLLEFIFEGKRWYDLRRMGDQYVYEYTTISSSDSYKLLWPIDRNTLTNNPDLDQTPGYPKF